MCVVTQERYQNAHSLNTKLHITIGKSRKHNLSYALQLLAVSYSEASPVTEASSTGSRRHRSESQNADDSTTSDALVNASPVAGKPAVVMIAIQFINIVDD